MHTAGLLFASFVHLSCRFIDGREQLEFDSALFEGATVLRNDL